ncbi:MAG: FG-GAP repeat protein [Pseudomonadota bacterium]
MNHQKLVPVLRGLLLVLALPTAASAQFATLTAPDGEADDSFGYAVAVSGPTLVSGAWQNDSVRANAGAVYVYEQNGNGSAWEFSIKLIPDDDDFAGDQFGIAVAIDGDWLLAGAPFDDEAGNDRGAAYVFRRTAVGRAAWTQSAKLFADDGAFRDFFGSALAISGNLLVVGSPEDDDLGTQSGSAYVFERNPGTEQWLQIAKLTAGNGERGDRFGSAVAISGDTVLVGAAEHNHEGVNNQGAAFVFRRTDSGWLEVATLAASDGDELDQLGFSVAIDGDLALVGAPFDDDPDHTGGAAYVFQRQPGSDVWLETDKLSALDAGLGDQFGFAVALAGGEALLGALNDDDGGEDAGAAYVFHRELGGDSWNQVDKLTPMAGTAFDGAGFAVTLGDGLGVVGAPDHDPAAVDEAGAAFLFELPAPPSDDIFHDSYED